MRNRQELARQLEARAGAARTLAEAQALRAEAVRLLRGRPIGIWAFPTFRN